MPNIEEIKKILLNYDYTALLRQKLTIKDKWREIQKLNELSKIVGLPTMSKGLFLRAIEKG